jgi:peptidoglycan hydrolase-like protein with peptidoglycan-binding domain
MCHEIDADSNIDSRGLDIRGFGDVRPAIRPCSDDTAGHGERQAQTCCDKAGHDRAGPSRPALQTPADTANAMAQGERLALQSDLAWVGQYNGAITGEVSERMVAAIKEFQKARGGKETGALNPQERNVLADTAKRRQENVGWKIVTDAGTGVRLGLPGKLVPQQTSDANGTKWSSPTGTIQVVLTWRNDANPTTAKLADREKKEPAGRTVDYTVVKPDFFVLSGLQGLKKFYVRGTFKGEEVRILTILYDQATENTVEPVVIAMSSAFDPFPSGAQIAGPPPRKTNTAPGSSSARPARLSPIGRSPMAASPSRSQASATPIASPRTRTMILLCCASTARAD